jgi:hypothetical protein
MPLTLRPNCEFCDVDLPPSSPLARICSYECTFCADCVEKHLQNVCPNCGGNFAARPIRPATAWVPGISLTHQPPAQPRTRLSKSPADIQTLIAKLKSIPPENR